MIFIDLVDYLHIEYLVHVSCLTNANRYIICTGNKLFRLSQVIQCVWEIKKMRVRRAMFEMH